ncbi:MAG TPA: class I SAM-dependent methyltransferase [Nitrospiria bacterium]|nr:class I SAM-dependent methyltransferase [Nitrospiria bacterium]
MPSRFPRHSTRNLKRLLDGLASCPAPHLLDLGRLCDQNIEWLIHHRCKVTVDDRITPVKPQPPPPASSPRSRSSARRIPHGPIPMPSAKEAPPVVALDLQQPADSFDAILCWDLLDYFDLSGARQVLQQLVTLLKPRGFLLAMFNCDHAAARIAVRYRIAGAELLEYEPLPLAHSPGRAYENREIQELFERFDLINSCFLPNQMREILVQKRPPRSPRS